MRSTPSPSPPSDTKDVTYDLIWEPRSATGGMAGLEMGYPPDMLGLLNSPIQ
jgi:hypothetical protein